MALTKNIPFGDGNTEKDGVNAHVANAGPSTPIKNYGGNMGFDQNFGAGRITNVRPKKGFKLKDVLNKP